MLDNNNSASEDCAEVKSCEEGHKKIEYYKHFYDTAPVGFYTTKISDGTFIKANDFCVHMLGCDSFEDLKENVKSMELYPPEHRVILIDKLEKYGRVTDFEIGITLPSGKRKWAILTARKCLHGDCLEGSITDITERKLLEIELQKYKDKEIKSLQQLQEQVKCRMDQFEEVANGNGF